MALINWNETYSVKVKEIDVQHKKLVNIINELHDKMKEGKGKEVVEKLLAELLDYTVFHFSFEEKLLNINNYPDHKTHAKLHADLMEQVQVFRNKVKSGNSLLSLELMNFLKKWLVEHILDSDKKYSAFLNAKGIN
ncbi:MAG: hemerythrin [Melioribacter sp. RIFOXYB12_FULL_38_5]|nr:MAG: hemerythrin [Melioribacter sp. RIFOXYB12_FULL_38_5]